MSSHDTPNYLQGHKAGADLSSSQYVGVKFAADDDVEAAASGQDFVGFLMNKPLAAEACEIAGPGGGGKAIAAGNIAKGNRLKLDGNGHVLAISGETAICVGLAMADAVDNDVFEVHVTTPADVTIS